ncbi:YjcZ family sporulation protein [Anaerobacillus sp. CMMVII]|uniref:YjcZ family sporulation protein n=1 Tax=Anaerobacillus sp. CMMVII TaxID=2755588 RepID=UPI0021B81094|nr:YjcZ family sporulation protein [Anaerobacillus sp. CMMVII]
MGYYGAPIYSDTPMYNPCCPTPVPAYLPVYPPPRHGSGFGAALIVVVVILLIILGAAYYYHKLC